LGFDDLRQYETQTAYCGCTVGRVAFRTVGGQFSLDGQTVRLATNGGPHHIHGGPKGFSRVLWRAEPHRGPQGPAVTFTYHSPDGDQGYPGNLDVSLTYTLTDQRELRLDYRAATDKPTPVNLTHHSYFNLAGHASGDILRHVLQLAASRYSPTDAQMTPTGALVPTAGTCFDFSTPTAVGARIDQTGALGGYDLAYLVNRPGEMREPVARLSDPASGRVMEVYTTQPALIFYSGNALDGTLKGKHGAVYGRRAGLCLETGHLPDSLHHPAFPSVILRPGQVFQHTCIYRFPKGVRE
jgi:aldose 1-epimerase